MFAAEASSHPKSLVVTARREKLPQTQAIEKEKLAMESKKGDPSNPRTSAAGLLTQGLKLKEIQSRTTDAVQMTKGIHTTTKGWIVLWIRVGMIHRGAIEEEVHHPTQMVDREEVDGKATSKTRALKRVQALKKHVH